MSTWESKAEYHQLSTVEGEAVPRSRWKDYPGNLRVAMDANGPPSDTVLIRTAGNALQAVSRQAMAEKNMLIVSVPENCKPGDEILVTCGADSDRMIAATIPPGSFPGSSFLVRMPPVPEASVVPYGTEDTKFGSTAGNGVVSGQDTDLHLHSSSSPPEAVAVPEQQLQDPDLILVKVPPGTRKGEKLRVNLPDGRVMEAAVPQDGLKEFYMRAPPTASSVPTATVAPFAHALD